MKRSTPTTTATLERRAWGDLSITDGCAGSSHVRRMVATALRADEMVAVHDRIAMLLSGVRTGRGGGRQGNGSWPASTSAAGR